MQQIFSTIKFGVKVSATVVVAAMCNIGAAISINHGSNSSEAPPLPYILGGFIGSTLPAIGLNIVNNLIFQEITDSKISQYTVMGFIGGFYYDSYINTVSSKCLKKIVAINSRNVIDDVANFFRFTNTQEHNLNKEYPDNYQLIYNSISKVINNNKVFLANTAAQTILIDMIWNGFPWSSNDKVEDIIQDDYELEMQPQDDYCNEYVMTAA